VDDSSRNAVWKKVSPLSTGHGVLDPVVVDDSIGTVIGMLQIK